MVDSACRGYLCGDRPHQSPFADWALPEGAKAVEIPWECDATDWRNSLIERRTEVDNKMPELKAGDVVRFSDGYFLVITPSFAYMLHCAKNGVRIDGCLNGRSLNQQGVLCRLVKPEDIKAVYRNECGGHWLPVELNSIVSGKEAPFWEKRPVRRVTISQLEEELNCHLIIVGEKDGERSAASED
jgi:hypothetical protein